MIVQRGFRRALRTWTPRFLWRRVEQDVGRLYVEVDVAFVVDVLEDVEQLHGDGQDGFQVELALLQLEDRLEILIVVRDHQEAKPAVARGIGARRHVMGHA